MSNASCSRTMVTDYSILLAVAAGVRGELLAHTDPKHLAQATQLLETLHELIETL